MIDAIESIQRRVTISKKEFIHEYYTPSIPVILTEISNKWLSHEKWSPEYFSNSYGGIEITAKRSPISNASNPVKAIEYINDTFKVSLSEFIERTYGSDESEQIYFSQAPIFKIIPKLKSDIGGFPFVSLMLLKLIKESPYLWMGPSGNKSALHVDTSPNLFAQIYGRKKWIVYPGHQKELLYLPSGLEFPNFSPVDIERPDLDLFPKFSKATPIEFTVNPGEILFLPANWAHYVEALDYSISLNLWWGTWGDLFHYFLGKFGR